MLLVIWGTLLSFASLPAVERLSLGELLAADGGATTLQQALLRRRTPVVVAHQLPTDWPGFAAWRPKALRKAMSSQVVEGVKLSQGPDVVYYDKNRANDWRQSGHAPPDPGFVERDLSGASFVDCIFGRGRKVAARDACDGKLAYHTEDIPFGMAADIDGVPLLLDGLDLRDDVVRSDPNALPLTAQLWFAAPGVTATPHYDVTHNCFVQLHGTKRFRLAPPTAARSMYLFPAAHPNARQSQATDPTTADSRFPLASSVEWIEAILKPGDLLYMPAYWFHWVDAKTASVSVNAWSSDINTKLAHDMTRAGLTELVSI